MCPTFTLISLLLFLDFSVGYKSRSQLWHKLDNGTQFDLHRVQNYDQIESFLKQLETENHDHMQIVSLGTTHEHRNIHGIRLSSSLHNFGYTKDVFWMDGGIHAREFNTIMTTLIVLTKVLNELKTNPYSSLSMVDWLFVPVMNVDGFIYARSDRRRTRMWRKTRSNCPCQNHTAQYSCADPSCCGVDLNRNFDAGWQYQLTQKQIDDMPNQMCGQTFYGSDPRGEPETRAIKSYILSLRRLKTYITLHDSGQLWMFPYANANDSYAKNVDELKTLSYDVTSRIQQESGRVYKIGTAPEVLYVAVGTSADWVTDQGIRYVFTVELPPNRPFWFATVGEGLQEAGEDMWIAAKVISQRMISP